MNDAQTSTGSAARADVAWVSISRASASGSSVEDRLAGIVEPTLASPGRRRIDVIYIEPDDVLRT